MSTGQSGQDAFGQSQQNFNYNDGTTQMSYSSQQYTWNSSQQGTPVHPKSPLDPQAMPQMFPFPDMNQIHQQHINLHFSGMQSAMQMQQTALNTMAQQFTPLQPSPPALQQPQQRQQHIQDTPSSRLLLTAPQNQSLQRAANGERCQDDPQAVERDRQMLGFARRIEDRMHRNDQQSQKHMLVQSQKEAAREAQDQQFRKEQREVIPKLNGQITELQNAQASASRAAGPSFDMQIFQTIIRDAQKGHASKDDLKMLIEQAVSEQLSGLAKSSDLEKSAARMERSLRQASGGSDAQIQEIVQKELTSAVNKVASHMPASRRRTENSYQLQEMFRQRVPGRLETQFVVEELPDDNEAKEAQNLTSHQQKPASISLMLMNDTASQTSLVQKKTTALSRPEKASNGTLGSKSDAMRPPVTASKSDSGGSHSKSRASVMRSESFAMVRVKDPEYTPHRRSKLSTVPAQASTSNAIERLDTGNKLVIEAKPTKSLKMSTMSVQPSESNALVKPGSNRTQSKSNDVPNSSSKKSAMAVQPSKSNAYGASSGYAQQIDTPLTKNPKVSTMSVQPSDANALVRGTPAEDPNRNMKAARSSKSSTMSVQPSEMNALARTAPDEAVKHGSKITGSRKMSVQPSAENAMVRVSTSDRQQYTSAAEAMAVAQAKSGQSSQYYDHQPEDSVNNASPAKTRQEQQAAKQSAAKGSTVSSIRPRNDRQGDRVASSPLKLIETIAEGDEK